MITPLPAAKPSALTTIGAWKKSIAFSASAMLEHTAKLPVGMLWRCRNCFANPLLSSQAWPWRAWDEIPGSLFPWNSSHDAERERHFRPDNCQPRLPFFSLSRTIASTSLQIRRGHIAHQPALILRPRRGAHTTSSTHFTRASTPRQAHVRGPRNQGSKPSSKCTFRKRALLTPKS